MPHSTILMIRSARVDDNLDGFWGTQGTLTFWPDDFSSSSFMSD